MNKAIWIIVLSMLPCLAMAARESDSEILLRCFVRYTLASEIHAQALDLAKGAPEADRNQIGAAAESWLDAEVTLLRTDLETRFKDQARDRFERFVGEYTRAEEAGDQGYLERLAMHTGLMEPPPDYATLRRLAMDRWLAQPLASGTRLLSEVQTWTEVRGRTVGTPPLDAWLNRSNQPVSAPPAATKRPVNPLAEAEADAPEWTEQPRESPGMLDAFAQRRKDRRDQAMADAQAGMQQMASERQAAEQEYGARKMAEAQADAEAMRAQAQKLAATEAEALAQRENSWGNRIKRIVGGTLSAGIGAFTGGVGAEAGQRAANELFK